MFRLIWNVGWMSPVAMDPMIAHERGYHDADDAAIDTPRSEGGSCLHACQTGSNLCVDGRSESVIWSVLNSSLRKGPNLLVVVAP
jgi:hypothetical protein